EAVDLFEDITATYYDYALLRKQFTGTGALLVINETLKKATGELDAIGFAIQSNTDFHPRFDYTEELNDVKKRVDAISLTLETNAIVLRKILVNIRKLFTDLINISQYFQKEVIVKRTRLDSSRFVSHQQLDPKIIGDNFSLYSSTFRHALRVCIACIAG